MIERAAFFAEQAASFDPNTFAWILSRGVCRDAKSGARQAHDDIHAGLTDIALACGFSDQSHFTSVGRLGVR